MRLAPYGPQACSSYAPLLRGHTESLLFVHHGALMAQPFDSRRLELSGERTVIVPEVRYRRWYQAGFSVSSNGVLLYLGGSAESQQFSWLDRQARCWQQSARGTSLSPDEKHVAFYR